MPPRILPRRHQAAADEAAHLRVGEDTEIRLEVGVTKLPKHEALRLDLARETVRSLAQRSRSTRARRACAAASRAAGTRNGEQET